jgi:hypothetical protein
MKKLQQPWLSNARTEMLFILAPAIVPVIAVILFQDFFLNQQVSTIWWIVLVLCIDVSHVYSTLFRLYWDKQTFTKFKKLLIVIPVAGFIGGFFLHWYDSMLFWRVLAYIAVYHFVRQQYGFLRLYSRMEQHSRLEKVIDTVAIYAATLYPLVYWHITATEKIAWFIKGDFVRLDWPQLLPYLLFTYLIILGIYVAKEARRVMISGFFNIPKNLVMIGTFASWYVGIVAFQGDLIFTLLNVVAHGIPYMALIWLHGEKKRADNFRFTRKGVVIFMGVLFVLAYLEEYIWDRLVWQDHADIFPAIIHFAVTNSIAVSMVVSLLVLPQMTHYVLDGFIWRFSKDQSARI